MTRSAVSALVLAGGTSRRFGSDKTRALVDGVPMLERVVAAVSPSVSATIVVGPWAPVGSRSIVEPEPHEGPLVALAFGLDHVMTERVVVVGGDHPWLVPGLLSLLLSVGDDRAGKGGPAAVVAVREGRIEPLVACYRTEAVRVAARAAVEAGERRISGVLDRIDVSAVAEEEWRRVDPDGRSFEDVDTIEDLHRGEAASRGGPWPERP